MVLRAPCSFRIGAIVARTQIRLGVIRQTTNLVGRGHTTEELVGCEARTQNWTRSVINIMQNIRMTTRGVRAVYDIVVSITTSERHHDVTAQCSTHLHVHFT